MTECAQGIAAVADKLARLIPRLATDLDGEVVATARAIARVLRSADCDFHDLSAALLKTQPTPKPEPDRWTATDELLVMAVWLRRYAINNLTDHGADFVEAMTSQLPYHPPTRKQADYLRDLYREHFRK